MCGIDIDITKHLETKRRTFDLRMRLSVDAGWLIFFGPSGSGKTLTLKALAGLLTPDAGAISVGGIDWFNHDQGLNRPPASRRVGYLFQDYALFPHLSVFANVGFGLKPNTLWRLNRRERACVNEMLELLELGPLAQCYPDELSGGQRQRTALARALISRPHLLLLDEPFAALDPFLRLRMRQELKRIQRHFDIPVVMITHDPEDLNVLAQTVVMVENGSVTQVIDHYPSMRQKLRWFSHQSLIMPEDLQDVCDNSQRPQRGHRHVG